MKRQLSILTLIAILVGWAGVAYSQDFVRLCERDLVGTARYVGMSGAMTAIGGDPSAVRDNPAGLGIYRRMEVTLTGDYSFDRTAQANSAYSGAQAMRTLRFTIPQAALVFAFGDPSLTEGVIYNNLMFSYQRIRTYSRSFFAEDAYGRSLGSLLADYGVNLGMDYPQERTNMANVMRLDESGIASEYGINWAMNISHRWYVGAGLRVHTYSLSSFADYGESFTTYNANNKAYSLENKTSLVLTGAGCSFSAGLIYRPIQWVRLGCSIETPSLGGLGTLTTGTVYAQTDSMRTSTAPNTSAFSTRFHTPMRLSVSAAGQITNYALIALQYD